MTTQRNDPNALDPMQAGAQMWEAGYQQLVDGWRQTQEFWNGIARQWGGMAGSMMGQTGQPDAAAGTGAQMEVMRELQEASFAVGQAWMRLPMAMLGGGNPNEMQDAIGRLTQAQGRAYQLWTEAMSRTMGVGNRE